MRENETPPGDASKRDNGDARAVAARHAERARRYARLRGINARLAASLDRSALFAEIVRAAAELFNAPAAALLLSNEEAQALRIEAGQGLAATAAPAALPVNATFAGRALATRDTIAVEDTSTELDIVLPTLESGARPGAMIVAPIRVEGKPFGVIEVYYAAPQEIPREDADLLDALSDTAAIALRNATAYARILEQGAELARRNDELARQKAELARLNEELRRADILKNQFLSTMSHELRTPLTSIIGFSSILLRERRGETLSDRQRDNVGRILSSARHLVALINDVLDLSRIESGRLDIFRREIDLAELVRGVCAELMPQALDKGLDLHVEIDPAIQQIETDGDRLRQVLTNLVDNAIKFTFMGGVTVRAEREAGAVQITVEDTGIGIPPDQQERIFGEFYQIDQTSTRAAGGTGLGLAISRRLVGLVGGRLALRSAAGAGSAFTITLPLTGAAHGGAAPVSARDGLPHRKEAADGTVRTEAPRVLVIDDDPEMVVLLERVLEGSPYAVSGALSADDGVAKARELQPDAILLDVMMPETDGWRALHRLKSDPQTAHIPVAMHTIVDDRALGFSLGATDYLVKPVEREYLLTTLSRLVPQERGPVLIVDDDANMRTLLSELLAEEGVPVVTAANGEEALRRAVAALPRLIVLDLMLPLVDGFTVLQRLRADRRTRHVPVAIVTAKALNADEVEILERDASVVITKSGTPLERLLDDIRGVMEDAP